MSFVPPFRIVTSEDGHYLGSVDCSCTYDQWFTAEFDPHCVMHSASDEQQRALARKPEPERADIATIRGISVSGAEREQRRGAR